MRIWYIKNIKTGMYWQDFDGALGVGMWVHGFDNASRWSACKHCGRDFDYPLPRNGEWIDWESIYDLEQIKYEDEIERMQFECDQLALEV